MTQGEKMHWYYLLFAGLFEIVWATSMKYSDGFTKPAPSVLTITAMFVSFALLSLAMRALPLGTAYTIWTGIGAAGAFIVGIFLFGEAVNLYRVASAGLVVAGIIGLRLSA